MPMRLKTTGAAQAEPKAASPGSLPACSLVLFLCSPLLLLAPLPLPRAPDCICKAASNPKFGVYNICIYIMQKKKKVD